MLRLVLFVVTLASGAATASCGSGSDDQVSTTAAGFQAYRDLALYYSDSSKEPPYQAAIDDLGSANPLVREKAGAYLLALFRQSLADESNGRAPWRDTPYWGGGAESDARQFREELAEAFGERASGEEAMDAAMWLLEHERLARIQSAGARVLQRTQSPQSSDFLRPLLRPPHPNAIALKIAVTEVGKRQEREFEQDILLLCNHYRETVRDSARGAASQLGIEEIPPFRPQGAFTPWLIQQLRDITDRVQTPVPPAARWCRVEVSREGRYEGGEWVERISGWLLGETASQYEFLSIFGEKMQLEKLRTKLDPSSLAEEVERLLNFRYAGADSAKTVLSRRGSLTAQFQPSAISIPEALVAAWSFERGGRSNAARILFPRMDAMEDDRWLPWITRDLLGHVYHHKMLEAFSYHRDYPEALSIAQHISRPVFDDYQYQGRAKELARQLAQRGDDFRTFVLPDSIQWEELRRSMPRDKQIAYLTERLRLVNCFQWGQPGGVGLLQDQFEEPHHKNSVWDSPENLSRRVINPYRELLEMEPELGIGDLPALAPFVADENFLPTFEFWRDFHPNRHLFQVNEIIAGLITRIAGRDLANLEAYYRMNPGERERHIREIIEWSETHADKSLEERMLETLATSKLWSDLVRARSWAEKTKNAEAIPILMDRLAEYTYERKWFLETCFKIDSFVAVPGARELLADEDRDVRFWAATILLRHGDKESMEGFQTLRELCTGYWGDDYVARAFDALLETQQEEAIRLACRILQTRNYRLGSPEGQARVQRLFHLGRPEALDYLLWVLDYRETSAWSYRTEDGERVKYAISARDRVAQAIAEWRLDEFAFDLHASEEERQAKRDELKGWLEEEFERVQSGEEARMNITYDR
jgi:hypothetical protein